ncbi:MAG: hypothetical protein HY047_13460 [Acidobacteria bacterium]|nr:hypothetical protein [Acidobacteriota bacterium]
MDPLTPLARALQENAVRFVVIGVAGANYYALNASTVFLTQDRGLFLPPDPDNLVNCWAACDAVGLHLWSGDEPLDSPRDRWLAERIVERRALTRATDGAELQVDLTLVTGGCAFDAVWKERRVFQVDGVDIPVARLLDIVTSKHAAGRDKDRLFLATHREALEELLRREER